MVATARTRTSVRVTVAESETLSRQALLALLGQLDEVDIVGEGSTLDDIEHTVCLRRPDVAVVGASLITGHDRPTMHRATSTSPGTHFLLVGGREDLPRVRRMFALGAHGFITRDAHVDELVSAIGCLASGERYLHPSLGAEFARSDRCDDLLTARELEVVSLVALGHTNADVALSMHISTRTVESHRATLMARLRLRSRAELVRWALDNRLIGPCSRQ